MRSGMSPEDYLRVVATKKPRLQALLDQLPQMSRLDIEALSEPLWVREALLRLKESSGLTQRDRVAAIVQRVIEAEEAAAKLPPVTYEVRLWNGGTRFVGTSAHHGKSSWKIEIKDGDTFAIIGHEQVRFGDSMLRVDDGDFEPLVQSSKLIGYMTLNQYRGFHKALLNQRHHLV